MCKDLMPRAALVRFEVEVTSSTASLTTIVRQTHNSKTDCDACRLLGQGVARTIRRLETLPFHPRFHLQIALEEQYEAEDCPRQDLQICALPL